MSMLIEYRRKDSTSEEGDVSHKLNPLLEGKGVVLEVRDTSIAPKRRVAKPLLFLTPGSVFGIEDILVATLMGHGGEVIDTTKEIRTITFLRMGVGARTANVLSRALTKLYSEGIYNGNITQTDSSGEKPP